MKPSSFYRLITSLTFIGFLLSISFLGHTQTINGISNYASLFRIYTDGSGTDISFGYKRSIAYTENMRIKENGKVGIGTDSPLEKLEVNGNILAQEIKSTLTVNSKVHKGEMHVNQPQINDASGSPLVITDKPFFYVGTTTATPISFATKNRDCMMIDTLGNVYIGAFTTSLSGTTRSYYPSYGNMSNYSALLTVNGSITCKGVKVTANGWADYVFDENYKLPSLSEVETYINKNKHLPDVPSAAVIEQEGVNIAPILKTQMQKIEELTLYLIEQNKKIERLTAEYSLLKKQYEKQ